MEVKNIEERLKQDFKLFLFYIWQHLNLPNPTPIQYDIADYLQYGGKRTIIEAFRGVGKSFITSAFVVWLLYRDPQLKIMVVSASKERSDAFSQFTKRLISEVPWLKFLEPRPDQRSSLIAFDVAPARVDHSPSVKSVGITGQLTGSRADIIVADDIETLNNSATITAREKLLELIKEFDSILKPLESSRIIFLGTPQSQESIYNKLPERGYETRVWCALYPTPDEVESYKGTLAPFIREHLKNGKGEVGKTTDPKRFSDEDLRERLLSYGKAGFQLQFMLNTALSDLEKYPLKLQDLMVMNLNTDRAPADVTWAASKELMCESLPTVGMVGDRFYKPMWKAEDWLPYTGAVMAIDPSGRGKDETAYAVVKMLNGYLYVLEAGGVGGGYDDASMENIVRIAKRNKVNEIIIESNFGDGMFTKLLEPYLGRGYPCTTTEVRHNTQKEVRIIDTLEPVMMQHRLIVDEKLIVNDQETAKSPEYSLFWQMTRLCSDRGAIPHDDRLDALAIAIAYWTEQMNADVRKLEEERIEQNRTDLIEAFLNGVALSGRERTVSYGSDPYGAKPTGSTHWQSNPSGFNNGLTWMN
ncbi:TPA: phage terminase large subunit [Photobacterium damselae]